MSSARASWYWGGARGVAKQSDRQIGPQHAAVVAVVRLLDAEVVAFAGDQLAVELMGAGDVVGVDELGDVAPGAEEVRTAEHPGQGVVDDEHFAVEPRDADADDRALEHRLELGLARVQRLLGLGTGGQRGPGDGRLLIALAFAQLTDEAGGERMLQPGTAGAALLLAHRFLGRAVEHQIRVDDAQDGGERVGFGALGVHQRGPDLVGGRGVEGAAAQRGAQPAGQWQQIVLELVAGHRRGRDGVDGPAPDGREPPEPGVHELGGVRGGAAHAVVTSRPARFRGHIARSAEQPPWAVSPPPVASMSSGRQSTSCTSFALFRLPGPPWGSSASSGKWSTSKSGRATRCCGEITDQPFAEERKNGNPSSGWSPGDG